MTGEFKGLFGALGRGFLFPLNISNLNILKSRQYPSHWKKMFRIVQLRWMINIESPTSMYNTYSSITASNLGYSWSRAISNHHSKLLSQCSWYVLTAWARLIYLGLSRMIWNAPDLDFISNHLNSNDTCIIWHFDWENIDF